MLFKDSHSANQKITLLSQAFVNETVNFSEDNGVEKTVFENNSAKI
tara:strand:+ start:2293 stop:2430 length:138 start_codon:yes stop_codon:yes gene_type:complete